MIKLAIILLLISSTDSLSIKKYNITTNEINNDGSKFNSEMTITFLDNLCETNLTKNKAVNCLKDYPNNWNCIYKNCVREYQPNLLHLISSSIMNSDTIYISQLIE